MAYSLIELREIRRAEREFYEKVFTALPTAAALYFVSGHMLDMGDPGLRGEWIDSRALIALNRWRRHFCSSREGLPIEPEWTA